MGRQTRIKIDDFEYEVNFKDKKLFDIPAAKEDKLKMLKQFVLQECDKCWVTQPKQVTTLKRQFLRELVDSLSS